ncbi:unnamed protein product [Psylliodes chrysocephalus]|uniref:Uncharacterized protein n=1 Tax=Psylliodes chrysocephalus TaxID=3402493 RepID=A0A9P0CBW2_9CUCU|nr:unnamed protein product [Psylliodes chrysocephala]
MRNNVITAELQQDFPFFKNVAGSLNRVKFKKCTAEFSVSHGGRSDVNDHLKTAKHRSSEEAAVSSSKITQFFKNYDAGDTELVVAAKEATFAFHTAKYDLSFKTSDYTSKRKEKKLAPVVVRYFVPNEGVHVKLLDFQSIVGETSQILSDHLVAVIRKFNISEKTVGYCGDNCNMNFGADYAREIGREIIGIGCGAHIVHNCLQNAVDVLPIDLESLVVKIYKYVHIYTVRVTQLQEFCTLVNVEYKKLLQHGKQCPLAIKKFFDDERGELYLWFVHGQLQLFNQTILNMEKSDVSATDVAMQMIRLKTNLQDRLENKFIPHGAKQILKKLEGDLRVNINEFNEEICGFYRRAIQYLEL